MEIKQFKVGDVVKVKRPTSISPTKRKKVEDGTDTAPTIGRVVWAHPDGVFYVVEFRDRFSAEYKPMYKESFYPERMQKVHKPEFMQIRPAAKRSWGRQE